MHGPRPDSYRATMTVPSKRGPTVTRPLEEPNPYRMGTLALSGSIAAEALADSRLLHNASFLLAAAATEPITATKTLGNLNRRFVGLAVEGMRWPEGYIEDVRYLNKVVDEEDVRTLNLLRIALVNGGMLRRHRGAFVTTKRGRHLIEPGREGALFLALWVAYFLETNLGYSDRMPDAADCCDAVCCRRCGGRTTALSAEMTAYFARSRTPPGTARLEAGPLFPGRRADHSRRESPRRSTREPPPLERHAVPAWTRDCEAT